MANKNGNKKARYARTTTVTGRYTADPSPSIDILGVKTGAFAPEPSDYLKYGMGVDTGREEIPSSPARLKALKKLFAEQVTDREQQRKTYDKLLKEI